MSSGVTLITTGSKKHPIRKFVNIDSADVLKPASINSVREVVFYTSMARHVPATNKYEFEYPPEWRTSQGEMKLSIRGIYLKLAYRTVYWQMLFFYSKESKAFQINTTWFYTFNPQSTLSEFLQYLNQNIQRYEDIGEVLRWEYDQENDSITLKAIYNALMISEIDIADYHTFDPIGKIETYNRGTGAWFVVINMWNRGEILVKSEISNYSPTSHIGYTGIQYDPPKTYLIPQPAANTFSIELVDGVNGSPVELPLDGRDYIVIEATIT
jgi:hypothetical protein